MATFRKNSTVTGTMGELQEDSVHLRSNSQANLTAQNELNTSHWTDQPNPCFRLPANRHRQPEDCISTKKRHRQEAPLASGGRPAALQKPLTQL
jgi:hypothetical protein